MLNQTETDFHIPQLSLTVNDNFFQISIVFFTLGIYKKVMQARWLGS